MSVSDNKFRSYLVFEDGSSYGVSLMRDITYNGLVSFVNKKFKLNNGYVFSFSYKMAHGPVNIVDDDDVQFFANEVCRPKAALAKLFVKMVVKNVKVKPSSSKSLDIDLNESLFPNYFEPQAFYNDIQMPKNEEFETYNEFNHEFENNSNQPTSLLENNLAPLHNEQFVHKWETNIFENMPPIPDEPMPTIKVPNNMKYNSTSSRVFFTGDVFDDKESCMYEIGKKAIIDGYQFKQRKSNKSRYDVICYHPGCDWKIVTAKIKNSVKWRVGAVHDVHTCPKTQVLPNHRNATVKLLGRLLAPKLRDSSRIYTPNDIKEDLAEEFNIDVSYKKAWGGKNRALEYLSGCPTESFSQLPYYFHNLKKANDGTVTHIDTDDAGNFKMCFVGFGVAIQGFLQYLRPLIIIDGAHLKGKYLGTNLLVVGMDGNNQIVPIATGVSQGETGESWTWFLSKLKECIGEVPNLAIISDRHYAIGLACKSIFPNAFHGYCCRHLMMNCALGGSRKNRALYWKTCKAYTKDDFWAAISAIEGSKPEAYEKLLEAGIERWSRAYCPTNRYNYMTSNSAESVNALTRHVRKEPITRLMEWYRGLVQEWFCNRRDKYEDAVEGEISDWATTKLKGRMLKSANWIVKGIQANALYEVVDGRKTHIVDYSEKTCTCCQWQFSGIPCGHAIAVSRFLKQTDCNHLVLFWFKTTTLKGTYQGLVYPIGEASNWEKPDGLQNVKPPSVVKPQSGRPKNMNRIKSQREVSSPLTCTRCWKAGHKRGSCKEPLPKKKKNVGTSCWRQPSMAGTTSWEEPSMAGTSSWEQASMAGTSTPTQDNEMDWSYEHFNLDDP